MLVLKESNTWDGVYAVDVVSLWSTDAGCEVCVCLCAGLFGNANADTDRDWAIV